MSAVERSRFPARVYAEGAEPDVRFSLANERTFLAWVRTALALVAAGVALEALALHLDPLLRRAASVLLVLAGAATTVQAWFGWVRTERALRRALPLPAPVSALPVAALVLLVALVVLAAVVLV